MLESVKNILSLVRPFNRVYFYCVDPGAFNIMFPVYKAMENKEINIIWVLDGWCKKNKDISFVEWKDFINNYKRENGSGSCLILGSQMNNNQTHDAIQFCKDKGIFSVFVFDHWTNYLFHFWDDYKSQLYLPDKIFIMDETAKDSLVSELYPWLQTKDFINNIEIVGHPSIEKNVLSIQGMSDEKLADIRSSIGAQNKNVVLFLLEPIEDDFGFDAEGNPALGYTEYSVLRYFFNSLPDSNNTKIIIKPHPRQDLAKIRDFLSNDTNNRKADFVFMEDADIESLIAVSDEVVGITTVALITALKAGKKIKSIQVGRNKEGHKLSNEYFERNLIV